MSFSDFLNKTCTVRRGVPGTVNDYGHPAKPFSDLLTDVPCRLVPLRKGKEFFREKQLVIIMLNLYVDFSIDIIEEDQVVIGVDTYQVLLVSDAAGHGHHKVVGLEQVKT